MICRNCKKRIPDNSIICPKCGKIAVGNMNAAAKDDGSYRRNIAIIMTVCIIAVFFLLSSIPFVMSRKNNQDNTEPAPSEDNSVVLPAATVIPTENPETSAEPPQNEDAQKQPSDEIPPAEKQQAKQTPEVIHQTENQTPTEIPVSTRKPSRKSSPAIEPVSTTEPVNVPTIEPPKERIIDFEVPTLDKSANGR